MRLFICASCLFGLIVPSFETKALTFEELPVKQASKQWEVQIGKAEAGNGMAKPEKGAFHTYAVEIKNIGHDVASAEIFVYRNEPNSSTKFSLWNIPHENPVSLAKSLNHGSSVKHRNLLMAENATELEVDMIWTEKGSEGRLLKETFIFKGDES
ncbi:hypothetical protein SFC27_16330 [Bacillus licheniformis]|jgi:hypothetical protein|uniref:Uncharacterized protein n=4 Tax=Bacillaceae TaxID=186817 RepID=Q65GW1_BACLD|nr:MULTISPECIES: hypothetical protein [Bacillus]MBJ7888929.1 hypothetical protein [Bacillaceae bacterium HSR45]MBY8347347.1 hypothetical protein [Bacillus sp. PCH94]MDP4134441.1 hypothetical protein [Bacillota bacterium]AAU24337.1 hypothetical protein BL03126 [Bacillus licheniformis DSM 13 = ATCC 14580]AAU41703.1 hypothetical protein BLi02833 [Bacillus licheniformis DSM 13 = ATCC 14580]